VNADMTQVKVLISGGFHGAYDQLVPEFEQAEGIETITGSGASRTSSAVT